MFSENSLPVALFKTFAVLVLLTYFSLGCFVIAYNFKLLNGKDPVAHSNGYMIRLSLGRSTNDSRGTYSSAVMSEYSEVIRDTNLVDSIPILEIDSLLLYPNGTEEPLRPLMIRDDRLTGSATQYEKHKLIGRGQFFEAVKLPIECKYTRAVVFLSFLRRDNNALITSEQIVFELRQVTDHGWPGGEL